MIRPSQLEEAALVAAFSLRDAIDTINQPASISASPSRDPRPRQHKRGLQKTPAKTTAEIWNGWHFRDDELVDGGGNRYGQSEIRAIFYTRKLLWHYQEQERARRPVVNLDPVQLSFDAVLPAWKVFATR